MSDIVPLHSAPDSLSGVGADEVFFAEVVAGQPVRVAAERAGLSLTAGYRRLHRPEFQRRLGEARSAMTHELALRTGEAMAAVASEAVGVLHELMVDRAVPPSVRASAAATALRSMLRLLETEEMRSSILSRLETLEGEFGGARPSGAALRGERP